MKSTIGNLMFLVCCIVGVYSTFNLRRQILSNNLANVQVQLTTPMPKYAASQHFGKDPDRTKIIRVLFPLHYHGAIFSYGPIYTKPLEIALDNLRAQPNWLNGYELVFELFDDNCLDSVAVEKLFRRIRDSEDGSIENRLEIPMTLIIGCPQFGRTISAEALQYFNFYSLGVISFIPELHFQRERYPTYFAVGQQADISHVALVAFIKEMGWSKLAVLSEMLPFYDAMERTFLPNLESDNITVSWFGKVSYMTTDSEEMEKTFSEMAKRNPRIVVLNADSGMSVACWLHKFGMFGPGYVLFFLPWAGLAASREAIPSYVKSWCSVDMIKDVMASSFLFGESTKVAAFDPQSVYDSTGMNGAEFTDKMRERIIDFDTSPFGFFPPFAYDLALFAGLLLNRTEELLQADDNTLLNLNGSPDIIERAIYSMPMVKGFKGEYQFEKKPRVNSKGYVPVTFTQIHLMNDGSLQYKLAAFYKSSDEEKPLRIINDTLKWNTKNGKPPLDEDIIKVVEIRVISIAAVSTLISISCIVFVGLSALLFILLNHKRFIAFVERKWHKTINHPRKLAMNVSDSFAVSGISLLLLTSFTLAAIGSSEASVKLSCICISILSVGGVSATLFGNLIKLLAIHRSMLISVELGIAWLMFNFAILSGFLTTINIQPVRKYLEEYNDSYDVVVIYRSYFVTCEMTTFSNPSLVLFGVLAGSQISFIILTAKIAFSARSKPSHNSTDKSKTIAVGVYCELLIIAALGIVGIAVRAEYAVLVVSTGCLILASIELIVLAVAKISSLFVTPPPPSINLIVPHRRHRRCSNVSPIRNLPNNPVPRRRMSVV